MSLLKTVQEKLSSHFSRVTEESVRTTLSAIMDPDLGKDIVSLGFVRNLKVSGSDVTLDINLTTPACPVKDKMKTEAEELLRKIPGIGNITVNMTATTRGKVTQAGSPIAASLGGVKNIIAVASGKGGVGKSTTAVRTARPASRSTTAASICRSPP
jgi:ATP-binding protein involved in chromosome partitioning